MKRLNEAIACDDGYNAVGFSYGGADGNDEYDPMNPTEDETGKGTYQIRNCLFLCSDVRDYSRNRLSVYVRVRVIAM